MTTIHIPTAEQLGTQLAGLDRLLTARNWERAAIVWAFTTAEEGRPSKLRSAEQFPCPIAEFVSLGFKGLGSRNSVARYRAAWQDALDSGHACSVAPGDEVELPDLEFPPAPDPRLRTEGTDFADSAERAAAISELASEFDGRARGALRAATSSPETLQVVAHTATPEQAQALMEGLRRRALDHSEPYVQSLGASAAERIEEGMRNRGLDPDAMREKLAQRRANPPEPDRPTPGAQATADQQRAEREEYYGRLQDFTSITHASNSAAMAAHQLTEGLARMATARRTLDDSTEEMVRDNIRHAREYLTIAEEMLGTQTSVADSATEWLKNNS